MGSKTEVVGDGYEVGDILKAALLNYLNRCGVREAIKVTDWSEYTYGTDTYSGAAADAHTTVTYLKSDGKEGSYTTDGTFYGLVESIRYQKVQITMTTEED